MPQDSQQGPGSLEHENSCHMVFRGSTTPVCHAAPRVGYPSLPQMGLARVMPAVRGGSHERW